ncbi:MAG: DUF2326 domain-containing protein [Lentisphaeria bacterium]|nr:DUF2326 domain-containing protein [Lentisphaeria bacterium]
MKLSRLYSNRNDAFPPITFNTGLNVVLAEIRDPANLDRDTHNLGKTTLAHLIDFCLLKRRHKDFFLFKHEALFEDFVFFLELRLDNARYVTIRRPVSEATKISFRYTSEPLENLSELPEEEWDHWRVPFDKSKELLEAQLDFSVATNWPYRKSLGYALRLQDDYRDVFQLGRFAGAHADWKPFLAELVGLDGGLVNAAYELATEAESVGRSISEIEPQLAGLADSPDRLEGMILLRSREVEDLARRLENFDFKVPDETISESLVNEIEASISALNERRYHLRMSMEAIRQTLGETIRFDLANVERVFSDAQIYFGDQLKHDYTDLLGFLTSISKERAELLEEEKVEISSELTEIESSLGSLNSRRIDALAALREAESLAKYRKHTEALVDLKATLSILERQRDQMDRLTELRHKLSDLQQRRADAVQAVESNIKASTRTEGVYRRVRLDFGEVIKSVLDRAAVLSCSLNNEGNIEFRSEILNESGTATSEDDGHTYKKLLCIAFDVAVFSTYLEHKFLHFVFHDGAFESLDDRKKFCLLAELRKRCDSGLQQIITVIDSDLPVDADGNRLNFSPEEIVRLLHDQGEDGRLFRLSAW